MRYHLFLLCFLSFLTSTCRVVEGPLGSTPESPISQVESVVRDQLGGTLRSMTGTLGTIGMAYQRSVAISKAKDSQNQAGNLVDGSSFFTPSSTDVLEIVKKDDQTNLSQDRSEDPSEPKEVYNFKYSLTHSQAMTFPNPKVNLLVSAKGTIHVIDGTPKFVTLEVSADVQFRESTPLNSIQTFKIATMEQQDKAKGQLWRVSFGEYRRLVQSVYSLSSNSPDKSSDFFELWIDQEHASISANGFVFSSEPELILYYLKGDWNYRENYFQGDAKISFSDVKGERFGIHLKISKNQDPKVSLSKFEN